jgi:hypothetical protein
VSATLEITTCLRRYQRARCTEPDENRFVDGVDNVLPGTLDVLGTDKKQSVLCSVEHGLLVSSYGIPLNTALVRCLMVYCFDEGELL